MPTYEVVIDSLYPESGDDVYCKPLDTDFSGSNWNTGTVASIEKDDSNLYVAVLDKTKAYAVYLNSHSQSFVANAGTDVITAAGHGLSNGETLRFKGVDLPQPLEQIVVYFVRDVTTDTFRVALTAGGDAIDITDIGSGSMTFTAPSKRSKEDSRIGSFQQILDSTLTPEGEEAIAAAVTEDVEQLLTDLHLDKLLAAEYDPENKPGVAQSLFNQLIENDATPAQFDAAALIRTADVLNQDATQTTARTNAATAATQATTAAASAAEAVTAIGELTTIAQVIQALAEADVILVGDGVGGYILKTYVRGTTTPLIPDKRPKTPSGANLTDPSTQELAGYRTTP
jgi:hypothetical protein